MRSVDSSHSENEAARVEGRAAAERALSSSSEPILLQDELPPLSLQDESAREMYTHWAMAWNAVWASEENQCRWGRRGTTATAS